ncbi:putative zinc finger protein [Phialemonium atrogriseum]|uniref:Zinc finger protein n=1 Tax=Phialemonium atrogriseum TaxID=1093897 RepID=A0AAJ0C443_9PEZI|nr:putative zinc finger protein [Phialemonium atrogriseum]KAK1768364.1 putative zinc finger protein [Phialemonium atrogriseum]
MGRHDSPPDSPLSSMDSSDGYDEDVTETADDLPPAKRQKRGDGSVASSAVIPDPDPDSLEGMSDVSSDTSGDVPSSPINARLDEEEFAEQVTVCAWEGCKAYSIGNMDKLVEHIHNDHIEGRQKKYTCEWIGCPRKSMPHASGYALKAHMRSHTREKPFYCYLPECDRAFTRSDALAKHMRTVHETEALRPSDPVPKSMQTGGPAGKSSKLKIILKTPQSHSKGDSDSAEEGGNADDSVPLTLLSTDLGFTQNERDMPMDKLYALCRCQVKWAEADGEALRKECKKWEALYKKEWLEKEVLLDQVVQSELGWHKRRRAVLSGAVDVHVPDVVANGAGDEDEHIGGVVTNGEMVVDAD